MRILQTASEAPPKTLPAGGPKTNDTFEELRQNPRSGYSLSMVYSVALQKIGEQSARGDSMFYNESEETWTLFRAKPGEHERKIFIQLVQVTHGGSIQFRVLDASAGSGWQSAYLPTEALVKSANGKKAK